MAQMRTLLSLFLVFAPALLLAGCGGGGGGGGNNNGGGGTNHLSSVFGKVVDSAGNPVPSGLVFLDGATPAATATFSQGGFEIDGVSPGFHIVTVHTTVGGTTYTGSTQIGTPTIGARVTNANIIVSPTNDQAVVGGYVYDSSGRPVGGARVSFESTFASSTSLAGPNTLPNTTALIAVTDNTGYYQFGGGTPIDGIPDPGLPVYQGTGNTARSYSITASALPVNGVDQANATMVTQSFTAGETLTNLTFHLQPSATLTSLTPTINYVQAFTQPDIQAVNPPQVTVASSLAVYQKIRAAISPEYAKLLASGHAAAHTKRMAAAVPHATASNYTVEMDVFFSLPGDTTGSPSSSRSELAGFNIYNDAPRSQLALNQLELYDILIDPLANFWADPDLAAGTATYSADTQYDFAVQSVATDGTTALGESASVAAQPLAFVNLSQPADPNDTGTTATLAADPVLQWTTIDPVTRAQNQNVGSYYVFLYSTFPGVSTAPLYQSGALPVSTTFNATTGLNSFTVPSSVALTAGTEYWVVIAASSSNATATSSALSVSQIIPFYVQ